MKTSLLAVLAGVLAAQAGGCAGVAWIAAQLAPPRKVHAQFRPPAQKRCLVLVDDVLSGQGAYETVKDMLTERLNQELAEHKIAASTIPYGQVAHLAAITPRYNDLSIPQIGRKLDADLVLYVQIDRFELRDSPVETLWHGCFVASVKMVDAQQGRLWPMDRPDGHQVGPVEIPIHDSSQPAHDVALTQELVDRMADRVAKLFYDHRQSAQELQEQQQEEPFQQDPPPP